MNFRSGKQRSVSPHQSCFFPRANASSSVLQCSAMVPGMSPKTLALKGNECNAGSTTCLLAGNSPNFLFSFLSKGENDGIFFFLNLL